MAIFAREFPENFEPGSDFVQIEHDEFALASEPQGLIAIWIENDQGYLTLAAAKRLHAALGHAIANSEAQRPRVVVGPHAFDAAPVVHAVLAPHTGHSMTYEPIRLAGYGRSTVHVFSEPLLTSISIPCG